MKNILDVLRERGFVKQVVYEDELKQKFDSEMVSFYAGFDPTADSMTIGHYVPVFAMAHLQKAGHKPYLLVGGGTAMIGDPSGRSDMRKMLTKEEIAKNVEGIKKQFKRTLSFDGKNGAVIVNNADWLAKLNYIDFIRDIGVNMSVNRMLSFDCFKNRMEKGLSFLELNYMPMQAYDFVHLFETENVTVQMGGDDQWANILAGADLIRRRNKKPAYAFTVPLLLKSDGTKMGKSAKGAVWLDKKRTTPYEMFQYFRNTADADVENCLKRLTFLELDEIAKLVEHKDERMNKAKEILAYEIVKVIHGQKDADDALAKAKAVFENGNASEMPTVELELTGEENVADLLVLTNVCKSKGEARRLITAGAVKVDGEKVLDFSEVVTKPEFVLQKGKKVSLNVVRK